MGKKKHMTWWQLALFGIGSTIGTGFFLASSIGIRTGGPSILLALLLAGLATYFVFDGLAKMTAKDPQKGAFRIYAQKAFGHWAGFSVGWAYWVTEILIMGSQLTALTIFTQVWFPNIPKWILAAIYAALGLLVLLLGDKKLSKAESIFAVMKVAAIFMFIIICACFLFGWIGNVEQVHTPTTMNSIFPNGFIGFWSAILFAFYGFGGIEVMGLMATELKEPKDASKAGIFMAILLVFIYIVSIALTLLLIPWKSINTDKSPFVSLLTEFDMTLLSQIFNGVFIIAGFSTMVASFFGVKSILVNLAEGKDAPQLFAKEGKLAIPLPTLIVLIIGLSASILMSLLLPEKVYEYITTGAGLMILYNWIFILLSARKLLGGKTYGLWKCFAGITLILFAVSGTIFEKTNRMGLFISIGFIVVIAIVTWIMSRKWQRVA